MKEENNILSEVPLDDLIEVFEKYLSEMKKDQGPQTIAFVDLDLENFCKGIKEELIKIDTKRRQELEEAIPDLNKYLKTPIFGVKGIDMYKEP